jgi:hypothetical protein
LVYCAKKNLATLAAAGEAINIPDKIYRRNLVKTTRNTIYHVVLDAAFYSEALLFITRGKLPGQSIMTPSAFTIFKKFSGLARERRRKSQETSALLR